MDRSPDHYVCIVSDHNYAELVCCISRKPRRIILIRSKRFDQAAERLRTVLARNLPEAEIIKLEDQSLDGDSFTNARDWARNHLLPALQSGSRVLNVTGGTKGLVLGLASATEWDWFDYKALNQPDIEAFHLHADGPSLAPLPAADISIRDAAELYSIIQWAEQPAQLNCRRHREMAKAIWHAQLEEDEGYRALFNLLDRVWSCEREQPEWNQKSIILPWCEIAQAQRANAQGWFARLAALAPEAASCDQRQLQIPGNHRRLSKQSKAWKRWVSGEWLEQLAWHWLRERLEEHHLALNPRSRLLEDGNESREADLLALAHGRTWVIEAKADLPPGANAKSIEEQISSLGEDRFGKVAKAILIAPQLARKLQQSNALQNFRNRCKAAQVSLCESREALLGAMGLNR